MSAARVTTAIVATVVAASIAAAAGQTPGPAGRHVILISIDGFAAFHLANASVELPNIRALAREGAAAESSETVFPSVTHPSHTTLVTGVTPRRHGVTGNRVVDRRTGRRFHITNLPRGESVRVPTLFDAVARAGRRTAAFFWPETKDDPAIHDNIAEVFKAEGGADPDAATPGLLDELRAARVPIDTYYAFYDDPFGHGAGDVALTQAAAHVFVKRTPALSAIHLLISDKAQHEFGPSHYLSQAALTTADHCVGLLRAVVARAGLTDRTTFVIGGDHGFVTVRHEMNIAPLVAEPALDGRVRWSVDGWLAFAEKTEAFDAVRDGPALDRVLKRVGAAPGIARVMRPGDMAALGFPDYDDSPYSLGHYIVAAHINTHLRLDAADRSMTRRLKSVPYHGHGYLPDHPAMYPALVLSGAGIARGTQLGHVRNVDVAPTIAALLGIEFPGTEGRVLQEALR